jgi:hypothetical protein
MIGMVPPREVPIEAWLRLCECAHKDPLVMAHLHTLFAGKPLVEALLELAISQSADKAELAKAYCDHVTGCSSPIFTVLK